MNITYKNQISIELFPFGETLTQYLGSIRAERKQHHEKTVYDRNGGGTRMVWDRIEFAGEPEGMHWQSFNEKEFPETPFRTAQDFQNAAEQIAELTIRDHLNSYLNDAEESIADYAAAIADGTASPTELDYLLKPINVWYFVGNGYEYFAKAEWGNKTEVIDTFPGDAFLGGDFARLTVTPSIKAKLTEMDATFKAMYAKADEIIGNSKSTARRAASALYHEQKRLEKIDIEAARLESNLEKAKAELESKLAEKQSAQDTLAQLAEDKQIANFAHNSLSRCAHVAALDIAENINQH